MEEHPKQTKQKVRKSHGQPLAKLRGSSRDDPKTRISKTLSYVLRHGAEKEGITMRPDGFVLVNDLVGETLPYTCGCSRLTFRGYADCQPKVQGTGLRGPAIYRERG